MHDFLYRQLLFSSKSCFVIFDLSLKHNGILISIMGHLYLSLDYLVWSRLKVFVCLFFHPEPQTVQSGTRVSYSRHTVLHFVISLTFLYLFICLFHPIFLSPTHYFLRNQSKLTLLLKRRDLPGANAVSTCWGWSLSLPLLHNP